MGTTERVAQFIVDFDFSRLPTSAAENIKDALLDTLGVALLATTEPVGPIMTEFVGEIGGNPQARLIGSGMRTSVLEAAQANGVFAHYEDYDDFGAFGHPGSVLTPAALALGEKLRLSGKKIIEGYAVGLEVGARLRANLGNIQEEAGLHSTSVLGVMAAAAQSAKMLGLDVTQTRVALGIAASLVSGIVQNFGTHTKGLHAGHAARSGLMAATLAASGFTGDPDVLEARQGYVSVYGQEQSDVGRIARNIGNPLLIVDSPVRFKAWPCCFGTHMALTALFRLAKKHDVRPEKVNAIEVTTPSKVFSGSTGPLIRPNPRRGYEGKASMQFTMAIAIVDGKVDWSSFCDENLSRPMVQELMRKVTLAQHPDLVDLPTRLESEPFSIVTLRMSDGRVISERAGYGDVRDPKGEEIYDKYRANARIAGMTSDKIERAISLTRILEDLTDVTELVDTVVR